MKYVVHLKDSVLVTKYYFIKSLTELTFLKHALFQVSSAI